MGRVGALPRTLWAVSKRRADGRPVTRRPKQAPRRPARPACARRAEVLLIFGLVGVLARGRPVLRALPGDRHPRAQRGLQGADHVRLLQRRQERARHLLRRPEPQSIPLAEMPQTMQDAVVAAENRTFWTDKGSTPRASSGPPSPTPRATRTQGASTITQQYVKILYLTSERSYTRKVKEAIVSLKIQQPAEQGRDPRGLPQHHLLRPRGLRRPGRGAGVLRQGRQGPQPARERRAGHHAEQPVAATTPTTAATQQAAQGPLPVRPQRDGRHGHHHRRRRRTRPRSGCRSSPRSPQQSQFGGQRGHMLTLVKKELLRLGFDEQEIDGGGPAGHHHLHPQGDGGGRGGRAGAAARGLRRQGAARRRRHGRGRHRRAARLLRRPGLPRLPDQLGRHRRHGRLDDQAADLAAAIKDGFSLKDTFDGNSPYVFPDGLEVNNEGAGRRHDYGSSVACSPPPRSRSTPPSSTCPLRWTTARRRSYDMATRPRHPAATRPSKKYPGHPAAPRPSLERHR